MAITGVTQCPSCKAKVNANWDTCLVCQGAIQLKAENSPIFPGSYVWYRVSDDPEQGPYKVTEIGEWMDASIHGPIIERYGDGVVIDKDGQWCWIHRCVVTKHTNEG